MEQETAILITGLQQHKADACQRLLATYGEMVFRMVQRIVTCREDAEEVYQDVFVKALRNIGDYNPRQASLATWLNRIAYVTGSIISTVGSQLSRIRKKLYRIIKTL